MRMRAPARAIAATPAIQAASRARNSAPTLTPPSSANTIPPSPSPSPPPSRSFAGRESMKESQPYASHGSGSTAWRQRTIPDFPELDAPLRTIIRMVTAPP